MEMMKAVRIHQYGGPEELKVEETPRPQAAVGEVLIRVRAAGVNPVDWKIRAGYLKDFMPVPMPFIPGIDVSGMVEAIGPGVTQFKKGDEVFGAGKGAYVIGTASGRNQAYLRELGVDEPIDYEKTRFEDVAHDVDVVLDTQGGDTQQRSWKVLKKGGMLVSIVQQPSAEEAAKYGVRAARFVRQPNAGELSEIARLVDSGQVKVVVDSALPLSEAPRAHELSQTGHARGKVVLKVG